MVTGFNALSMQRLDGVDPRLVDLLAEARARSGVPFEISEGLRDLDRQTRLVAEGKSQTMNSRHLTGNAVDIYIPGDDGKVNWDFEAYRPLGDLYKQLASERGLSDAVWGGDWKTLRDGVHFQLGGKPHAHTHAASEPPGAFPPPDASAAPVNALTPQLSRMGEFERANALMSMMPRYSNQLDVRAFLT